ncbi:MAG: RagB/SusD family nutrient uptake outer membrane protein, partial [Ginsengibacter sp.]
MNKISIILIFILSSVFYSCSLKEVPKADVDKSTIFSSEQGLKIYSNSFYNAFPSSGILHNGGTSYYLFTNGIPNIVTPNGLDPDNAGGWSWGQLRNINFFIDNCNSNEVPLAIRNNYIGIARFFRAYFYYNMMKSFGDIPWIDHALDVKDSLIYATQDKRTLIVDKIKEDLDFAIANISNQKDASASTITSTVAAAFKSRVCLWEGTFRKYHDEAGLASSANDWFNEAISAAQYVMDAGYSICMGGGVDNSYRALFTSKNPISSEVLYAVTFDRSLGIVSALNHRWTSVTYGGAAWPTRSFIKTYLMRDGEYFMDQPGAETMSYTAETKNRDTRLAQTIITPGFTRVNNGQKINTPPNFAFANNGYQIIKFLVDDISLDKIDNNENNSILFRYAEVLLNYAEAKAELETLTDQDWSKTIGVLRARGGVTGGLSQKPTKTDNYLRQRFFPNITDPSILEIRRERGVELSLEGFGFDDVKRWKVGELLTKPYDGIYIPAFDVPYDVNEDGILDVVFTKNLNPANKIPGVYYFYVGELLSNGAVNNNQLAPDGHTILALSQNPKVWNDRNYFNPIPTSVIQLNPNL